MIADQSIVNALSPNTAQPLVQTDPAEKNVIPAISSVEVLALRTIHIVLPMVPNDASAEFHKPVRAIPGTAVMSAQQTRYVMQEAAEHATVVITLKRMALAANQVLLRIADQSMKIVDLLMQIMNVSMTIACTHVIPVIVGIVLIKNVLQQTRLQIPIIAAVVVMHAVWNIQDDHGETALTCASGTCKATSCVVTNPGEYQFSLNDGFCEPVLYSCDGYGPDNTPEYLCYLPGKQCSDPSCHSLNNDLVNCGDYYCIENALCDQPALFFTEGTGCFKAPNP